jgi:hypothetical protein
MFDITSNAKVVIVVEKDATFQRLMQEDFLGFVDFDVLLITGKGVPDLSTRKLLYRLANQDLENALFLCLVDGDPYGVAIMLIYKVTSSYLVMSPSWNFPARAEPSYKDSEPSRAELGLFNFRAESELTKYCNLFPPIFSPSIYYQILLVYHNSNQFNDNLLGNKVFLS